ncbi:hypothetical protein [Synechococcus sp. PCC 7336]|nr:hypothetical protein [Synechococcus sp. PCC 7336]
MIAMQALSKSEPISHLAAELQVSRKFVYFFLRKTLNRAREG